MINSNRNLFTSTIFPQLLPFLSKLKEMMVHHSIFSFHSLNYISHNSHPNNLILHSDYTYLHTSNRSYSPKCMVFIPISLYSLLPMLCQCPGEESNRSFDNQCEISSWTIYCPSPRNKVPLLFPKITVYLYSMFTLFPLLRILIIL